MIAPLVVAAAAVVWGSANAHADAARRVTGYTPAQVQRVFTSILRSRPDYVTKIGDHDDSTLLSFTPKLGRTYDVEVTVDKSIRVTDVGWRMAAAWRYAGQATARIQNVTVTAGPPDTRIGVRGKPFPLPPLIQRALGRLRSTKQLAVVG